MLEQEYTSENELLLFILLSKNSIELVFGITQENSYSLKFLFTANRNNIEVPLKNSIRDF